MNGQVRCARQRRAPAERSLISYPLCLHRIVSLRAYSYHEVLRLFGSRVVNPVQFIGVNERRGSWSDDRGLSLNGHRDGALHQQEEFLVLVAVGWMRLASRSKNGLVNFKVLARVENAVKNRPGFVLPVLLYRQFAIRLDERASAGPSAANAEEVASMGIACRRERRVAFIESPVSIRDSVCYRPSSCVKSRQVPYFAGKIVGNKWTGAPCHLRRIAAASSLQAD